MKKIVFFFLTILFPAFGFSDNVSIEKQVKNFQTQLTKAKKERDQLKKNVNWLNIVHKRDLDSLKVRQKTLESNYQSLAEELGIRLNKTNQDIQKGRSQMNSTISNRVMWGIVLIVLIILIACVAIFYFYRRFNHSNDTIKQVKDAQQHLQEAQQHLQEESMKLDNQMMELLNKEVNNQSKTQGETDHSLILKVADEINRIQTNLSHMSPEIRGYKQLLRSVTSMRDSLMAKGYEVVEMVGKHYDGGMKVEADFVNDESLQEGEQIISKVIKPQVNYKGKMIQSAIIEVRQN